MSLPDIKFDEEIIVSSTGALNLKKVPRKMVVVGGGYIGLEMATVYSSLGTKVDVVEFLPRLLPGADGDLVEVLHKSLDKRLNSILLNTKVVSATKSKTGVKVDMETNDSIISNKYEKVLVSIGRIPNTDNLGLENAGINVNSKGFINVDEYRRTNIEAEGLLASSAIVKNTQR